MAETYPPTAVTEHEESHAWFHGRKSDAVLPTRRHSDPRCLRSEVVDMGCILSPGDLVTISNVHHPAPQHWQHIIDRQDDIQFLAVNILLPPTRSSGRRTSASKDSQLPLPFQNRRIQFQTVQEVWCIVRCYSPWSLLFFPIQLFFYPFFLFGPIIFAVFLGGYVVTDLLGLIVSVIVCTIGQEVSLMIWGWWLGYPIHPGRLRKLIPIWWRMTRPMLWSSLVGLGDRL